MRRSLLIKDLDLVLGQLDIEKFDEIRIVMDSYELTLVKDQDTDSFIEELKSLGLIEEESSS